MDDVIPSQLLPTDDLTYCEVTIYTRSLLLTQFDFQILRFVAVVRERMFSCSVTGVTEGKYSYLLHTIPHLFYTSHRYHTDCLRPRMEEIPLDVWYCRQCIPNLGRAQRWREFYDSSQEQDLVNINPHIPEFTEITQVCTDI